MSHCVLIDNEQLCFLKATPTVKQAEYWADIIAPTHDYLITGDANKDYSSYSHYELRILYYNTTGEAVPDNIEYNKILKGVADLARSLILDETPLEELQAKLGREIGPVDPRPAPEKGGRKPSSPGPTTVTRPKAGSSTGKVWEIADSHYGEGIPIDGAFRTKVIETCVTAGINPATASTQFGKWKKHLNQA